MTELNRLLAEIKLEIDFLLKYQNVVSERDLRLAGRCVDRINIAFKELKKKYEKDN